MFHKIRNKYVITNMLLIGSIITLSFLGVLYTSYKNSISTIQSSLDEASIKVDVENFNENEVDHRTYTIIFDEQAEVKYKSSGFPFFLEAPFQKELLNAHNKYDSVKIEDSRYYRGIYTKQGINNFKGTTVYTIVEVMDVTQTYQQLTNLFWVMLLILLIVLGLIFIVCVYLANKSVNQLREAWDKQRQFIGDASHELKTPLAIIRSNVDALQLTEDNQWTHNIKSETERMSVLITDLLYLTKIDDYKQSFNKERLNVSDLLEEVLLTQEVHIYEEGIQLETDIQKEILLKGDREKMKQLVHILIDNAIKYCDKSIHILLKQEFNTITFSIENDGPGIPPSELSKVFDRFYKTDKSRHSEKQSYGLGLSIASVIVSRMKGEIYVQSVEDQKTKFTVIFDI